MIKGVNMSNVEKVIRVDLSKYANGYIATSETPEVDGLFLSYKSFDKLIKSIPTAIRLLMRAKYGVNFIVQEKGNGAEDVTPVSNVMTFSAKAA